MRYALTNATFYTGAATLTDHAVLISQGRIEAVLPAAELPAGVPRQDARGLRVAPGLMDLQVYGGGGVLFSTHPTPATLARLEEVFREQGTTHFVATMPTNAPDMMLEALHAAYAHRAATPDTGLLGVHLEGPYINVAKKGAHQAEFIRKPDLAEIERWLAVGPGLLRLVTMAPEVATTAAVARLRAAGVVLSAGHSAATFSEARRGFRQGFAAATHLFNAMSALTSREPGLVGAVYDDAAAVASIIADGLHCDFAALRISHKVLRERLFLITDAVEESPEGAYRFRRAAGRFVDEQGTLAGSALTMLQAVQNCVLHADIELPEALRMATLYPARVLGLDHELGRIAPGYQASLTLFDADFRAHGVVLNGELLRAPTGS
ncbi:N-acetylglucosamine-6-phosphate deacetylase [Hymenobacter jeollabukensis]|uniref:N-acetylglucosamine-6-phosphate deacetylase n=1 Tax=Hymenobacter jeollabukensis TaxID=2025313 RepID=A0A5R8WRV1_9BACT|nr:N-acetylglucosamine-6-phosphate deacetylase [Hymenobacter jeollabukensis]TLM93173.1 N-acetylglucosamine-6-phosphate deacetylase [Hymenobacter jeollabukensis]